MVWYMLVDVALSNQDALSGIGFVAPELEAAIVFIDDGEWVTRHCRHPVMGRQCQEHSCFMNFVAQ